MNNWEKIWEVIISDDTIKNEYRKTFLLNIFQSICSKANNELDYKKHILTLFRQSTCLTDTIKAIVERECKYELSDEDVEIMLPWFQAYRRKSDKRKSIPLALKQELYKKQNGLCAVCEQKLVKNWSEVHVDHIIPWVLVGDELENNYQVLCETCNKCKNSKIDYIFKKMIKL